MKLDLKKTYLVITLSRAVAVLSNFILVSVLVKELNVQSYGFYALLISMINWIYFFDLGINKGLKNVKINGKSFKDIIVDDFRNKAGYYLESNLYNTIDFGIPQKRKRYIFIGSKNKEGHVLDNTPPDFVSEIKDFYSDKLKRVNK